MIKKLTGIGFKGGLKGYPAALHINYDYTSFANIAGNPAPHCFILMELNR